MKMIRNNVFYALIICYALSTSDLSKVGAFTRPLQRIASQQVCESANPIGGSLSVSTRFYPTKLTHVARSLSKAPQKSEEQPDDSEKENKPASTPVMELGNLIGGGSSLSFLDQILLWVVSDIGSLVLGVAGLLTVLIGRLVLSSHPSYDAPSDENVDLDSLAAETRVNILAILACGSVLSNGLSKLDVTAVAAETVELTGIPVMQPVVLHPSSSITESKDNNTEDHVHREMMTKNFSWLIQAVLTATSAKTAVILEKKIQSPLPSMAQSTKSEFSKESTQSKDDGKNVWRVLGFGGVVVGVLGSKISSGKDCHNPIPLIEMGTVTPILNKFLPESQSRDDETYLPNLPALPGRVEFESFLPSNTQAALLLPISTTVSKNPIHDDGSNTVVVLVLGSNQARSFTQREIAWCRAAAGRI